MPDKDGRSSVDDRVASSKKTVNKWEVEGQEKYPSEEMANPMVMVNDELQLWLRVTKRSLELN